MYDLLEWCISNEQKEKVQARIDHGSNVAAARHIGCSETSIRRAVKKARLAKEAVEGLEVATCELPKVLVIDIETAPTLAYVWRMWKENIGYNQVVEHTHIMCFAAKWLGDDNIFYAETRDQDDSSITALMVQLLDESDYVIAHNADRFDIPKINTAAILNGMTPPTPYKVIDTLKIAKKHFKFERNTLQHLAEMLGCSPKLDHAKYHGFDLWKECIAQNEEAWDEMRKYNMQDVFTLEEVYYKLRPWHKEHPNIGIKMESDIPVCSKCGSQNVVANGYTYTDVSKFRLYTCQDCGGHSRGRTSMYPKEIRRDLITTVR